MRKILAILLLLPLTLAQGADLMELYQKALESDPVIRAARSTRDAVGESRALALAPLLPQLSLSGEAYAIDRDNRDDPTRSVNGSTREVGVAVKQTLFRFDQWMNLDKSKYQVARAGAQLSQEELNLMLRVATTYFQILGAEDNLSFARAELRAIARQLDQAKQRFDVGLIAITDVHEVQAAYDQAKANEIEAVNLLDNAWEALREIVADYGDRKLLGLRARIPMTKPSPDKLESWIQLAMESNPGLAAAQNALAAARRDIDIARSGHLPTLDLVASASTSDTSNTGLGFDSDSSSIGLQLNLPLYAGGGVSASTRKARYDFQTASENLEQVRRSVRRNVSDFYRGVLSSISQVEALESATRSAQSALKATEAGFEVGTRTMVDVLTVQRNLYNARRNYAKARYDYILNGLRLKQAAGVLSSEDLRLVNSLLQGRS